MLRQLFYILILFLCLQFPCFCQEISIPFLHNNDAPYFNSPELMIDSAEYDTFVLGIKTKQSSTARFFWATSYDMRFDQTKSIWFSITAGEHDYYFNIPSQNPNWIGWIKGFIIYPEMDPKSMEIKPAQIIKGNLLTNIKSGWQEFWGPKGRLIEGSTVNNFRATTLWGKPINLYVYSIIFLIAFLSFAYFYFKTKELSFAWQNCGRVTVIAAIAFWGLLETSNSVNKYNQLKLDFRRYDFKSLEEKRAIAVEDFGKDFYPFLKFCQTTLPQRAKIKFLHSGPNADYPEGRAKYFLYPIDFFSTVYDYIIVYNYEKDLNPILKENPNFYLMKKFNERAYILWKK